jgi:TetR/AcrR family transcriptional regulator
LNSKTRILNAAVQIFAERGFHGARIEDIGTKAEINKAMVYYYYTDKNSLYQEALNMIVGQIYSGIIRGVQRGEALTYDPVQMLVKFIRVHFFAFSKNKEWSKMFMDALNYRREYLRKAFINAFEAEKICVHQLIEKAYRKGIDQGVFRDIDFKQVFINIIGMNVIYFTVDPIAEFVLDLDIQDKEVFLKDREKSIIDLLLRGVLKEKNTVI